MVPAAPACDYEVQNRIYCHIPGSWLRLASLPSPALEAGARVLRKEGRFLGNKQPVNYLPVPAISNMPTLAARSTINRVLRPGTCLDFKNPHCFVSTRNFCNGAGVLFKSTNLMRQRPGFEWWLSCLVNWGKFLHITESQLPHL